MADDSKATDVGARYAQALFDLAVETNALPAVEADLKALGAMIAASHDLRTLLRSPKFSAEEKGKGLAAIAEKAGLGEVMRKFLGLLAANRRTLALEEIIRAFARLAAARRGVVSAQVTTAVPLTDAQRDGVAAALRTALSARTCRSRRGLTPRSSAGSRSGSGPASMTLRSSRSSISEIRPQAELKKNRSMDIRASEISDILKSQIANFGIEADVSDVGQVLHRSATASPACFGPRSGAGRRDGGVSVRLA